MGEEDSAKNELAKQYRQKYLTAVMEDAPTLRDFQPTMLGTTIRFLEGAAGMITDENEADIFIESSYFTGWMSKAEFWEALGIEE